MTLNELFLESLEGYKSFYIDHGRYIKQLTEGMYIALAEKDVKSFYLDIKDGKPIIVVIMED